jgi:ElaB/YqjD/DUF883 family membrane-anchored ribosome-binding protein
MSMSFDVQPSVRELRAEAEANRARLTGTVDELRTQVADTATDLKERLSPTAIKAEVTDYVRDSRDQLWHSLEQKARDNPLQAVAVGAALAFPAFKLLRAMPAPLLLVGAGLLLSKTTGDQGAEIAQTSDALQERARSAVDGAARVMDDATSRARGTLHDARDYIREGVDTVQERAAAATSSVKERVTGAVDEATSAVGGMAERVIGQGSDLAQHARAAASSTWDKNPLVVAGAGLLIGAFIAAAFPSTETEETLFGDASDALRRQAEGVAAHGVDAARSGMEAAAATAAEQGLSADGLESLGESLTDKVRAVAERGVDAALGEAKSSNINKATATETPEGTRTS